MADTKSDKIWADAVRRAVKRRMENAEGKPQKIERLADQLIDFALEGNGWAFREIGERLDGKAPAGLNISGADGGPIQVIIQRFSGIAAD